MTKTLIIYDDCTITNSVNSKQLFVYCKPLNINTSIYHENIVYINLLFERIVMYL